MDPLAAYIDGWRRHDVEAVLATLVDDCIVTESFGPVYLGVDRVRQWFETWVGAGGRVEDWTITSQASDGRNTVAEWSFTYIWDGKQSSFDGITVARLQDGRIQQLREYCMTGSLYDWTGTWR